MITNEQRLALLDTATAIIATLPPAEMAESADLLKAKADVLLAWRRRGRNTTNGG